MPYLEINKTGIAASGHHLSQGSQESQESQECQERQERLRTLYISLRRSQKSKFRKNRCRLDHSMRNDLTKTMPVLICAETCQKDMFLRKYIFGVWPGGMRVALGIRRARRGSAVWSMCC